jgi:DNA-binding transcriptional MerR regulator
MTTATVAKKFGVKTWQVRRLYEKGLLAEPSRAGQYRLIDPADLPRIKRALKEAGYLAPTRKQ